MKIRKIISLVLIATMLLSITIPPVFAESTNENSTETEDNTQGKTAENITLDNPENVMQEVQVYETRASAYSVQIPKVITLNGATNQGGYTIVVSGDIADNEVITVAPTDYTFAMKSSTGGKADVAATITQDKTKWLYDEFSTQANGIITAEGITAGQWNGSFNFTISCGEVDYTPFTVTANNRSKIGYTGAEGENLVIPATFKDTDGTWYKVTALSGAFQDCTNLTSITIPDSVTDIGWFTFSGCTSLTSVTIPDGVTYIGWATFFRCTSLTSITIPDGVTSISLQAFTGCTSLTSVTIPDSVTEIGGMAFNETPWLTTKKQENPLVVVNNILLNGQTTSGSITIPDNVTFICEDAFSGCTSLTSVTIPDSVTYIGSYAFSGCTSLTSVTIPDNVTSINSYTFSGCTGLSSITIGNRVTSIASGAFYECTNLTSITYNGTMEQWNAITKKYTWNDSTGNYIVHCTDGDITKT